MYFINFRSTIKNNNLIVNYIHGVFKQDIVNQERYIKNVKLFIKNNNYLDFPHKKIIGNTNPEFIQKRKKEFQNYYNTLLKSIELKQLPELYTFFYQKRPQKQIKNQIINPNPKSNLNTLENKEIPKQETPKKSKQEISIKKTFQNITAQTIQKMIDISNDIYQQLIQDPKHKLSNGVQHAKYNPKGIILDQTVNTKQMKFGKNNQFGFWSSFFNQSNQYQKSMQQLNKIENSVQQLLKKDDLSCNSSSNINQEQQISNRFNFVMAL